jgi:hypothetical protein
MSGFYLKKAENHSKFEFLPVKILPLHAYFDPISGKWIDLADEESAQQLQNLTKKKESLEENTEHLKNALARTLCYIDSTKREIVMILNDQKTLLQAQGFEAANLSEKLQKSLEVISDC